MAANQSERISLTVEGTAHNYARDGKQVLISPDERANQHTLELYPQLLLLDEATSSLDPDNEKQIMEVISNQFHILSNKFVFPYENH